MKSIVLLMIAIGLASQMLGCRAAKPPASALHEVTMRIGSRQFELEVADTDDARSYGLMKRDSMPSDHGMIFVFADEQPRSFWMKNTRIPLDIVFLRADGQVVSVHRMKPYDLSTTSSDGPAKYAIELNACAATDAGVKPGDRLDIPPEARTARE